MAAASFDPSGFFEFDLATGSVHARGTGRVLILSDSVVAPLVSAAVGNGDLTSVRKLGRELGDCVVEQLGGGVANVELGYYDSRSDRGGDDPTIEN